MTTLQLRTAALAAASSGVVRRGGLRARSEPARRHTAAVGLGLCRLNS